MLDISAKPCFIPSDFALLKNVRTALFVQYLYLVSSRNDIKALLYISERRKRDPNPDNNFKTIKTVEPSQ